MGAGKMCRVLEHRSTGYRKHEALEHDAQGKARRDETLGQNGLCLDFFFDRRLVRFDRGLPSYHSLGQFMSLKIPARDGISSSQILQVNNIFFFLQQLIA